MSTSGDVYGIGTSGLLAFQRALSVTSHNIANVNTEGYSRQIAEITTREPINVGGRQVGTGVNINSVRRMFDELVNRQVTNYTSNSSLYETYHTLASQVDELLANESIGLDGSLQRFFDALQVLSTDPSSNPAREGVLSEAQSLVDRFHTLDEHLNDINNHLNNQMRQFTSELNTLAASFADLNQQIVANGGSKMDFPPNDLMDKRNLVLQQIASMVSVSTVEMDDGSINIFVGSGQPMVLGNQAFTLQAVNSTTNSSQLELAYNSGSTQVIVTDLIDGGKLGGVLRFRDEVVDPVIAQLDRLAAGFAMSFNDQHRIGMDLEGDINNNFFGDLTAGGYVLPAAGNTGTANITVSISDSSELTADDYQMNYNGLNYTLVNRSDNSTVATFPPAGAFPTTYTVAGIGIDITINVSNPNAGDSFYIDPDHDAAKNIDTAINRLADISAAIPIRAQRSLANLGDATISQGTVANINNPNLMNTVTITFSSISPDLFDVFDVTAGIPLATNVPYTSGSSITYNGVTIEITGAPQLNDVFTIEKNTSGFGDNRNALFLAGLQTTAILENGTGTYQELYGSLISDVGNKTAQAQTSKIAQGALLENAQSRYQSVSGVNLDEEAANIMKFQQAYQAAAQIMVTANSMFQSLIDVFRR
ncbi:MAG: flagellar hook-associated protein FlgK [Gammaproteobacteria bacterium RBG_16_57_12]|nr:MAG: flagellar hook-associated protein FlgK [Gammaproteobacteria bacterium RBG_16_57_12]